MTLCVTYGAPGFGPIFRYFWRRPEYVMFCTISATAVREMAVSVTFGAPRAAVAVAFWCGLWIHQIARVAREARFQPNANLSLWLWAVCWDRCGWSSRMCRRCCCASCCFRRSRGFCGCAASVCDAIVAMACGDFRFAWWWEQLSFGFSILVPRVMPSAPAQLTWRTGVEPHLACGLRGVMGGWDVPSHGGALPCHGSWLEE